MGYAPIEILKVYSTLYDSMICDARDMTSRQFWGGGDGKVCWLIAYYMSIYSGDWMNCCNSSS